MQHLLNMSVNCFFTDCLGGLRVKTVAAIEQGVGPLPGLICMRHSGHSDSALLHLLAALAQELVLQISIICCIGMTCNQNIPLT